MAVLSDILGLLDRWPAWKAMTEAPARITALEARIAALEARMKPGGVACPACGGAMGLVSQKPHPIFGDVGGLMLRSYRCDACGFAQELEFNPTSAR
jgi:predicted RNA-binding Zn-ribbon protein involved in translation (DUF1610 family)